jgi:hypothetical protein
MICVHRVCCVCGIPSHESIWICERCVDRQYKDSNSLGKDTARGSHHSGWRIGSCDSNDVVVEWEDWIWWNWHTCRL